MKCWGGRRTNECRPPVPPCNFLRFSVIAPRGSLLLFSSGQSRMSICRTHAENRNEREIRKGGPLSPRQSDRILKNARFYFVRVCACVQVGTTRPLHTPLRGSPSAGSPLFSERKRTLSQTGSPDVRVRPWVVVTSRDKTSLSKAARTRQRISNRRNVIDGVPRNKEKTGG